MPRLWIGACSHSLLRMTRLSSSPPPVSLVRCQSLSPQSIRPDFGDGSAGSLFIKFVGEAHVTRRGFHGDEHALANAKPQVRDLIGQSARVPALESD